MSALYAVVAVTTTPTLVTPANLARNFIILQNQGSATVYFGWDTNITTSSYAFTLTPQSYLQMSGERMYAGNIYGIVASTTTNISYGDVGQ